jgi:MFS family permease
MQALRSLPRTVWLLGLISFLNDAASELIYPLLPLYLSAAFAAGPRFLGLLEGIAEALASVVKLYSGVLADRFSNRKLPTVLGYAFAGLSRPLYALVPSIWGVLLLRILDRLGKALRSAPRDALLAESVAPNQRGLAFGLHRSMDHAGATVGPLLAALLIALGTPIQSVLLWSIVPGLACVAMSLGIQEQTLTQAAPTHAPLSAKFDWQWNALPLAFRHYLIALGVFSLGNASKIFLLLQARAAGLSVSETLFCWAAMAAIASLLTTPLSALSDHFDRRKLLVYGWVLQAALCTAAAFIGEQAWGLYLLFAGFGLLSAATEGTEKAYVADLIPSRQKAGSFGWFYLFSGLPLLPASFGFGWIWERFSPTVAFLSSAAFAILAALMLAVRGISVRH